MIYLAASHIVDALAKWEGLQQCASVALAVSALGFDRTHYMKNGAIRGQLFHSTMNEEDHLTRRSVMPLSLHTTSLLRNRASGGPIRPAL